MVIDISGPGLSVDAVHKHLLKSDQKKIGHIHRLRQNIQSTTKITPEMIMNKTEDEPPLDPPEKNQQQGTLCRDQRCKF